MGSRRRWWLVGWLALTALAALVAVAAVRPLLAPFGLALAMAYLLAPAVGMLERWGFGRSWAILAVYLALGLAAVALVLKVLPAAYWELRRLVAAVPGYTASAREWLYWLQSRVQADGTPPVLREGVERVLVDMEVRANRMLVGAVANLFDLLEWGFYLVLAPVLAYYLLRDMDAIRAAFVRTLPRRWRRPALELVRDVDRVLAGFVRGQLLLALMVGMLAALTAQLLGLRYGLLLGLWAGIAELVPYVGPLVGAAPAVLLALSHSPVRALQAVLAFAVIQQLENAVLGPRVLAEAVGLHPLVVLVAVLSGGYLAGVPGMVLAVPAVGLVRVVWRFALRQLVAPRPVPDGTGRRGPE